MFKVTPGICTVHSQGEAKGVVAAKQKVDFKSGTTTRVKVYVKKP